MPNAPPATLSQVTVELRDRATRLEREREERARAAVAEERARIARELHDVIAHSMSVIVVQAGAAEQILEHDPAPTREALGSIRRAGNDALRRCGGCWASSATRTRS